MAANEQGKFWEMHDKLFANQQRAGPRRRSRSTRRSSGWTWASSRRRWTRNKFDAQIAADMAEGTRVGANGTPTFFINGRQLVGAQPIDAFKQVIDEELKKAGVVMAADAK